MGVDWGAVASSSGGGGGLWAQHGTSGTTSGRRNAYAGILPGGPAPSSSGGGLFDFIGHEIASHTPGAHLIGEAAGGVGEVTRGLAGDVANTIHAIPQLPMALYHFNQYDAKKYPVSLNPLQDWRELTKSYNDPHSLGGGAIKPTVKSTERDIHNVRTGNFHALAQHPLSPVLDALSVASLGGGALLKGAKVADEVGLVARGGRVSRLADDEARVLHDENLQKTLPRARTAQGRLAQNAIDRFSQRHPEMPVVGVQPRLYGISGRHGYYRTEAEKAIVHKMQRAGTPLNRDEEFALHIAAEGLPLRDRIALYGKLNAENPSSALQRYIRVMQRPGVAEALKNPRDEFASFAHQVHGVESKAGETLIKAGKLTEEGRAERAAAPLDFAHEHGINIGESDISPKLPQGFRFPHVGTTGNPSLFRTPLGKLMGTREPGLLKRSRMIRFARGQFITNPQSVYSEDFMRTARYLHELDLESNLFDKVSRPLDVKQADLYGRSDPEAAYYWPTSAREMAKEKGLTPRRIPREARDAEARNQDLSILDPKTAQEGVAGRAEQTVGSLHDLGLEGKTIEHLKELGVRQVPKTYAAAYRREFGRANGMVRLLIDKPTSAWRSLTLKYRPAWAVNNLLGQHLLYAMANPTLGGAVSYGQALLGHRRNAEIMEETPGMRQGFATTQKGITHTGGAQPIVDRSATVKAVRGTAKAIGLPVRAVVYPIRKFGDGIQAINQLGENIPREAQFLHLLKKHLDLTNKTLDEAVRTADPQLIQRLVDEVNSLQGDFGNLNHVERTVLRRALPFYSWFKVITKLTLKYAKDYPVRLKMLQSMSNFLNEPDTQMPSYLRGFVNLVRKGQTVTGLSTTGANPFETVPQLLSAAGGVLHGKPTFGTDNPGGLLNPGLQALFTGVSGTDNFTGNTYRGPGANEGLLGRATGQFLSGLPEYRLAEQAAGLGPKSTLYDQSKFLGLPPYLWNYLGLPIRRVKLPEAHSRKRAGQ
jgi:hypothetical protein